MKTMTITNDEYSGRWSVFIDHDILYECLADDELMEIIRDELSA